MNKTPRLGWILSLYLLGIFMGAIDTGIITPARTVIQQQLGLDDTQGIWMLTIYTLGYAASIPIMGKLADRIGRKRIYLLSISLFTIGSLLCGLSQDFNSYAMLISARALQAIGGGGILPVATAEFGTTVPKEKRGMALGLVGAVFAVANIFGSSAGSLILGLAGNQNWQWIFYVNLPIGALIIGAGIAFLPNTTSQTDAKIDLAGITVLVAMILSLLYGIRSLDFFHFQESIVNPAVYPFLLTTLALTPILVSIERRAADPVMNLKFFTSRPVGVTLFVSFISGVVMMSIVFIPQFAENSTHIATGAGGYFVIILGLASGIGAPSSGKLTDKFGPKPVLAFGFLTSAAALAVVLLWTIPQPSMISVLIPLFFVGLGMGFFMGSPLNYMMLDHTREDESNSALATLSLIRAVGTTLAPAVMAGFLAQAGLGLQPALMDALPTQIAAPALPHAQELDARFAAWKADPDFKDKLAGVNFPKLSGQTVEVRTGGGTLAPELVELLKSADVTNIVERIKTVAEHQFDENTPKAQESIRTGVDTGISSLKNANHEVAAAGNKLKDGINGVKTGLQKMQTGIDGITKGINGMTSGINGMTSGINGITEGLRQQQQAFAGLQQVKTMMENLPPRPPKPPTENLNPTEPGTNESGAQPPAGPPPTHTQPSILDMLPPAIKAKIPPSVLKELKDVRTVADVQKKISGLQNAMVQLQNKRANLETKRADLKTKRANLESQRAKLQKSRSDLAKKIPEMESGLKKIENTKKDIDLTIKQLTELKAGVPEAFNQSKAEYLKEIDARKPELESIFQGTLNDGFAGVFTLTAGAALLATAILVLYPGRRKLKK